ncbi:cytochrome c oxidase subunit II [Paracoccus suum]|uniref:Cytochrome c oxidase subunit 2 n=1 Tax=Paracoccus suum TaxID=2259340 RepID=A0A344PI85_9RHOB|nr:cytochrome c oxidase subunit II [Paracoccus suum]AXC49090.1 cytochrome c oxidase subunit II [Paracoccus suum]
MMLMAMTRRMTAAGTGLAMLFAAGAVHAQEVLGDLPHIGKPVPKGMGFQPGVTSIAHDQIWLDHFVLLIITAVVIFVVALLLICIFRFNQRVNPIPARFSHNTPLEIAWTLVPVLILLVIGIFSLPILFRSQEMPSDPDVVIKAIGNQWYWSYEYPEDEVTFDSLMLAKEDLEANGYMPDEYLLAVDNAVVVPVGKKVLMQYTANDVIHSWAMPSFAIKQDAVPGRIAQAWFTVDREGVYFGQCSELCGINHAYMPIVVKAVSPEKYAAWMTEAKQQFASADAPRATVQTAAASAPETNPAPTGELRVAKAD